MSVLQERIFHPTYMRLLCLHVRRRGVSLADALSGMGMTWRELLHEKRLIPFGAMRSLILAAKRLTACALDPSELDARRIYRRLNAPH